MAFTEDSRRCRALTRAQTGSAGCRSAPGFFLLLTSSSQGLDFSFTWLVSTTVLHRDGGLQIQRFRIDLTQHLYRAVCSARKQDKVLQCSRLSTAMLQSNNKDTPLSATSKVKCSITKNLQLSDVWQQVPPTPALLTDSRPAPISPSGCLVHPRLPHLQVEVRPACQRREVSGMPDEAHRLRFRHSSGGFGIFYFPVWLWQLFYFHVYLFVCQCVRATRGQFLRRHVSTPTGSTHVFLLH